MCYVRARADKHIDCETYRFYITSALKVAADNTAGFAKNGESLSMTYEELKKRVKDARSGNTETRTGEEIVEHMKNVLGKIGEQ